MELAMTETKRAGDIMIPLGEYPHIPYWFTLRQAMAEMESSRLEHRGEVSLPRVVLVFDERYQLVGLARRRDILRGLEPDFLAQGRREAGGSPGGAPGVDLTDISFDRLAGDLAAKAERAVSEVMQPVKATVQADDHILKVMYAMTQNNVSFIPVLAEGQVVGVVRTVELFHEIAHLVL